MGRPWRRILAAAMAALLLCTALAEGLPGDDIQTEAMEEAPGEAGDKDLLPPGLGLEGAEGDEGKSHGQDDGPEATNPATPEPIPWYSSVNYASSRVNFEGEVWNTMTRGWGLEDFQAAGLMGSMYAESSFSPYNAEGIGGVDDRGVYLYDPGDSVGFGLCQWTTSGRKGALLSLAASRGNQALVWDFDTQMEFMRRELDLDAIRAMTTLYEVAEWAVLKYERPNLRYKNSWPGTRYEHARAIYQIHTGKRYKEPKAAFSVAFGGEDALALGALAFPENADAGEALEITVTSNYYWRLHVDGGEWLEIKCGQFYHPDREEDCVCGYAMDGDKTVRLIVKRTPQAGTSFSAMLTFELYRAGHLTRTLPVSLTCTSVLKGTADRAARLAAVGALLVHLLAQGLE